MDQPEFSDARIIQPEFPSCRVEMIKLCSFREVLRRGMFVKHVCAMRATEQAIRKCVAVLTAETE